MLRHRSYLLEGSGLDKLKEEDCFGDGTSVQVHQSGQEWTGIEYRAGLRPKSYKIFLKR